VDASQQQSTNGGIFAAENDSETRKYSMPFEGLDYISAAVYSSHSVI
jgi:hypothetical protein